MPALKGSIPWNKNRKETRISVLEKQSNSHKGIKPSAETIEKRASQLRGKKRPPYSEEWIKNMSESHKGKKQSSEQIEKRVSQLRGSNNHMFGKHHKKETIEINRIAHIGKKHSEETKKKMSESHIGKKHPNRKSRIPITEKTRKKLSEYRIAHPNLIFKNTSIELKVETELIKRGIVYQKQVPLCKIAIVDFYLIDYNIVIQCDGCYWHNCPIHKSKDNIQTGIRDKNQDLVLKSNGFIIYRFWEHDINKSAEKCLNSIGL